MANNGPNIQTTFTVEFSDLTTGLNQVNQAVNNNKRIFEAATAGMDDWKNNADGLNAKLTQLRGNLSLQQQALKGIEDEIARVTALEGDHSTQLDNLNKKYLDTKKKIGSAEKQIRKYTQALKDVNEETDELADKNKKAQSSVDALADSTEKLNGGFTGVKNVITNLIATAITSFVSSIAQAISASREFRKELGMLEVTAKDSGANFDNAKENLVEVASITNDTSAAVEGLNNLMTAGFDGKALDEITNLLTGASIKWKDTLKFEGLADGLQETLATGKAIGPFAELLERSGLNLDTFNKGLANCTTEAEKQNYVLSLLQKEGLADVKDSYVETNQSLIDGNKAMLEYETSMAQLSEKLDPIFTAIRNGFTQILDKIIELVGDGSLDTLIEKISTGFTWFTENVVPLLVDFFKWLIENIPLLTGFVTALVSKLVLMNVANMITKMVTAIKAWTVATKGQTIAQKLLNTAVKSNPLGAIVSLIATIVGALVTWAMTNEKVGQWFKDVWDGIVAFFKGDIDEFLKIGENIVKGLWDGIKSIWDKFAKWFENLWSGLVDGFKDFFGIKSPSKLMAEMGGYLGEGVGVGIKKSMPKVKKDLEAFNSLLNNDMGNIKGGLLNMNVSGNVAPQPQNAANGINQVINAGMTVNYNGNLSRKQLKQLERDNYNSIRMKLKAEGLV